MKQITSLALGFVLGMMLPAGSAQAQINSPPPALMGQPSYHLYSVSGVMSGVVGTFFHCTNTTAANIRVGVEVFFKFGGGAINDPSATSLDLAPGAGALFGTSTTVWVVVDSDLAPGPFSSGSARILATESKGIICSAFLADPNNVPPTSMADLKVVKKTKQKGE